MKIRLNSKEQENLVLENQKLVHYVITRLGKTPNNNNYDDIVSVGTIGLIKAAATFELSKEIAFSTYAYRCIRNEILLYFREEKSYNNCISLNTIVSIDDEGSKITLEDSVLTSTEDFTKKLIEDEFFITTIHIILNVFTAREKFILLNKIAETNQTIIANNLNISRSYVSKILKNSYQKLKYYITTKETFEEFFSIAVVDDFYQISFALKDTNNFSTILKNITFLEDLQIYKVFFNNQRISIQILAQPEYFSWLAEIILEIDNLNIVLIPINN